MEDVRHGGNYEVKATLVISIIIQVIAFLRPTS